MANETFYKKLNSLEDLNEMRLSIVADDEETVSNNLQEKLKEKGLLISDLSKLTGISRQNINAVIRNKMKPSIEFVLKVSYVLGLKNIDDIFTLSESAWFKPYGQEKDGTIYLNMVTLTMMDTKRKRIEIKESGHEYYNVEKNETLSKEEYELLLREYLDLELESRIQAYREQTLQDLIASNQLENLRPLYPDLDEETFKEKAVNSVFSPNQVKSKSIEEIKEEFNAKYSKLYKKVGVRIDPYVLK